MTTLSRTSTRFYARFYGLDHLAALGGLNVEPMIINKSQSQTNTGTDAAIQNAFHSYSSGGYGTVAENTNRLPVGTRFFGVKLSANKLGWIEVKLTADGLGDHESLSILSGAYNDQAGASIHVGTVPEPSSFAYLGLLAAGAGGVLALKKFRKQRLIEEAKA